MHEIKPAIAPLGSGNIDEDCPEGSARTHGVPLHLGQLLAHLEATHAAFDKAQSRLGGIFFRAVKEQLESDTDAEKGNSRLDGLERDIDLRRPLPCAKCRSHRRQSAPTPGKDHSRCALSTSLLGSSDDAGHLLRRD